MLLPSSGLGGSGVVTLLFMYLLLFVGVLCWALLYYVLLCALSSFAIILMRYKDLVALFLLFFDSLRPINNLSVKQGQVFLG